MAESGISAISHWGRSIHMFCVYSKNAQNIYIIPPDWMVQRPMSLAVALAAKLNLATTVAIAS